MSKSVLPIVFILLFAIFVGNALADMGLPTTQFFVPVLAIGLFGVIIYVAANRAEGDR